MGLCVYVRRIRGGCLEFGEVPMWGQLPAPCMRKAIVLKVLDEGSEGLGEAQVSLVSSLSF